VLAGMAVSTTDGAGRVRTSAVVIAGVPTTEADLSRLTTTHRMMQVAADQQDSVVALLVATAHGTRVGTGIVAEAGGILVALRPTVEGARSITVVERDGTRQPAVPVGSDPATGIVVLRIPDDLPVADVTTGDPATGSVAMALSMSARTGGGAPTARVYAGRVLYAGLSAGPAEPTGLCGTAIAAPLGTDDLGSPLVEPSGTVAGVLDAVEGTGVSRTAVFLPAGLVRDVAAQIVDHGTVDHGVLGAEVVDQVDGVYAREGALVADVTSGSSAAQAGLQDGDLIVSVGGDGVRSVAELATRLYAEAPGTELPLTVRRGGRTVTTVAVLGDS